MAGAEGTARRGLLLAAAGAVLGGCGFRPLYGSGGEADAGVQARLAEVNVQLIPERSGQLLRQALQTRLERGRSAIARRYDLSVQYALSAESIGIQSDSSGSRVRLIGVASWALLAQDAQRTTLVSGSAREVDAVNVINQQFFAAELTSAAVQRRMVDAVAEQIATQLAVYFARKSTV